MYRHAKRLIPFLLLALLLPLLGPDSAFTQGAGRGKARKGGSPFDRFSGGADTFDVNTAVIPRRLLRAGETEDDKRANWQAFLQKKGVTNGLMTRALFQTFLTEQANRPQGKRPAGKLAQAKQGGGGIRGDAIFNQYSGGKDVFDITTVPIPPRFLQGGQTEQTKRDQWQAFLQKKGVTNGQMTRELFRSYLSEQSPGQAIQVPTPIGGVGPLPKPAESERPTVYRVGKLPKDLPAWFAECDKDRDGQIGLYEWKASGRPVSEFLAMDRNGDGFLTVEEVLRYQKTQKKKAQPASASRSTGN